MRRSVTVLTVWALVASAVPPAVRASAHLSDAPVSLDGFLTILRAGNQPALERYIARNYHPEALKASSAAERADRLARLYVDTGGFRIERRVRQSPESEVAVASARLTQLPSCLVLKTASAGGRALIRDFEAADLPLPASPILTTPSPKEIAGVLVPFMNRLARVDSFSGVIVVAKNGRPFLRKVYGYSDVDRKVPNRLDTGFNIASIGKTVTTVLIAQLLDEGRLSLDDKVGKFLPDYPDLKVREKVTIRHLLTHTSGLGEKSEFTASPLWGKRPILTIDDYMPQIVGHPLVSEPGTKYSYSNAGYVILGKIIETVSGRSFYDLAAEKIFKPMGMRSSLYQDPAVKNPRIATSLTNFVFEGTDYVYRLGPKTDATGESAVKGGSHGGAVMSAEDLLRFVTAVRLGRLTSPATTRLLLSPHARGLMPDAPDGLGFEVEQLNGHKIIGHRGGDIGISAIVYHFEPTGYTAVVLSNYDPRAIRPISRRIRTLVTRKVIGKPTEAAKTECDGPAAAAHLGLFE